MPWDRSVLCARKAPSGTETISFLEEEIKSLASTVDRLQEQLRNWAEERYGAERIELIDLIEKIRWKSGMRIGGAIGGFENELFEVVGSNLGIIAVGIPQFVQQLGDAAKADIPFIGICLATVSLFGRNWMWTGQPS